jgi:ribonuclease P protein component
MRLTAAQHLRRGADFEAIRSRSVGNVCEAFRLRILPTESGMRRLGVIASKRVGNSVVRNRARRLLREAFRNCQDRLPASCDILLIASSGIVGKSGAQVRELYVNQVTRLLRRLPQNAPRTDAPGD